MRASDRYRPTQIMREGSDAAATRQMIADECNTLNGSHIVGSRRLFRLPPLLGEGTLTPEPSVALSIASSPAA